MTSPVLLFRADVEHNNVPVAQTSIGPSTHGLQRVPVLKEGLDHAVDLGQTRLPEGADGLPRSEHVFVGQPVVT